MLRSGNCPSKRWLLQGKFLNSQIQRVPRYNLSRKFLTFIFLNQTFGSGNSLSSKYTHKLSVIQSIADPAISIKRARMWSVRRPTSSLKLGILLCWIWNFTIFLSKERRLVMIVIRNATCQYSSPHILSRIHGTWEISLCNTTTSCSTWHRLMRGLSNIYKSESLLETLRIWFTTRGALMTEIHRSHLTIKKTRKLLQKVKTILWTLW